MTDVLQVDYPNDPPLTTKSDVMEECSGAPCQMIVVQPQLGSYGGKVSLMTAMKSSTDNPTSRPVPTQRK